MFYLNLKNIICSISQGEILSKVENTENYWLNEVLSKSESVEFSLIESVICLFTDSSVQKYFSLTNQLIFTD